MVCIDWWLQVTLRSVVKDVFSRRKLKMVKATLTVTLLYVQLKAPVGIFSRS